MPKGRPALRVARPASATLKQWKSHCLRAAPCRHPLKLTTHLRRKARQAARLAEFAFGDECGQFDSIKIERTVSIVISKVIGCDGNSKKPLER